MREPVSIVTKLDDPRPALLIVHQLSAILGDATLMRTKVNGRNAGASTKSKSISHFTYVGTRGQATLEHLGVLDHAWIVEDAEGRTRRLRITNVQPHGLSREECHRDLVSVRSCAAALAEATDVDADAADETAVQDWCTALHALGERLGFDIEATHLTVAGPHSLALAHANSPKGLRQCELTDLGRQQITMRLGRMIRVEYSRIDDQWVVGRMSARADSKSLANVMDAMRAHARSDRLPPMTIRATGKDAR